MTAEALKSTPITNLDASPPVRTTTGKGVPGVVQMADGTATATDTTTTGSTYRLCRIPSNAIVKQLWACLDTAVTTFTVDMGVYYPTVGAPPGVTPATALDADLFASAVALASIVVPTQYTMEAAAAALIVADMFKPLWDLAGLTSDPGCDLDIVFTTTATTDGTPIMYCAVYFVCPGA